MTSDRRYAFIGLGDLGGELASSLLRRGFAPDVFDRDRAAMERVAALGAMPAASAAEAAAAAGKAITCLPSPTVSEAVLEESGVAADQRRQPAGRREMHPARHRTFLCLHPAAGKSLRPRPVPRAMPRPQRFQKIMPRTGFCSAAS